MLEYFSKSHEYDGAGKPFATKVTLINNEGANVPIFLPPEVIDLSNSELYELAMDKHYQDNFPQRAEKEKFAEQERLIAEVKMALSEAKEATIANRDAVNQAIVEMTDLVASIYAKLAEAGIISEEEDNDQSA